MRNTLERLGTTWPDLLRLETLPRIFDLTDIRVEEFTEDDGKTLVVRAELPGIDPDKDVEITVTGRMLTLRAERREESKADTGAWRHSEFHYGSFERMIALPEGASEKDIKAVYKDGILQVRIPLAQPEVAAAAKIAITRE